MIDEDTPSVDRESLIEVSKPLFYGFTFMAALTMTVSPQFAGTLLGVAVMAAVSFVAAGLSDIMQDDWKRFMDIVAIVTLLGSVLAASYISTLLAVL